MKKNCEQCGVVFEVSRYKGDKQRFCSPSCSRRWWYENPHIESHVCLYCGKEFIPKERNRNKACSRECGLKYGAIKRKKKKYCLTCGEEIIGAQEPDYCTEECRPKRYCAVCGKELSGQQRKYCSNKCDDAAAKQRYLENYDYITQSGYKECEECGEVFYTESRFNVRRYCSYRCGEKAFDKTEKGRESIRKQNRRQRAIRRGVQAIESFSSHEIFERDGWKCQLCGKKVNPKHKYPHEKSATIDHIIPISQGGTHEKRNVQLAHFVCNSKRGDKGPAQMRLF